MCPKFTSQIVYNTPWVTVPEFPASDSEWNFEIIDSARGWGKITGPSCSQLMILVVYMKLKLNAL